MSQIIEWLYVAGVGYTAAALKYEGVKLNCVFGWLAAIAVCLIWPLSAIKDVSDLAKRSASVAARYACNAIGFALSLLVAFGMVLLGSELVRLVRLCIEFN